MPWYIEGSLRHISNVNVNKEKIDSTIADVTIRDKIYVLLHGDYDSYSKSGAATLVLMLGYKPYALVFGHMHQCGVDDASGIKLIRSGSLGGSGDEYTVEKRLYGKPSQMVCVCSDTGAKAYYPIDLE